MPNQGRSFTDGELVKIIRLLSSTDMSINQIAERMGRSRSAILGLNRRHAIRDYSGQRNRWKVRVETVKAKDEQRARVS